MNEFPISLIVNCMSLGDTYLQLGQLEKAEKYLKKGFSFKRRLYTIWRL